MACGGIPERSTWFTDRATYLIRQSSVHRKVVVWWKTRDFSVVKLIKMKVTENSDRLRWFECLWNKVVTEIVRVWIGRSQRNCHKHPSHR